MLNVSQRYFFRFSRLESNKEVFGIVEGKKGITRSKDNFFFALAHAFSDDSVKHVLTMPGGPRLLEECFLAGQQYERKRKRPRKKKHEMVLVFAQWTRKVLGVNLSVGNECFVGKDVRSAMDEIDELGPWKLERDEVDGLQLLGAWPIRFRKTAEGEDAEALLRDVVFEWDDEEDETTSMKCAAAAALLTGFLHSICEV